MLELIKSFQDSAQEQRWIDSVMGRFKALI